MTFVLAIPGKASFDDDLDFTRLLQSGDSLLQVLPGAGLRVDLRNDQESAPIEFQPNAQGRLATATLRLSGQSFMEVERAAYDLLLPLLSRWSLDHNVAIEVGGWEIVEERTMARRCRFGMVGNVKPFSWEPSELRQSTPETRRLLPAYREGLSSDTVFYQVLSFYKVAEGVRNPRAPRAQEARSRGEDPESFHETIPAKIADIPMAHPSEAEFWEPYLGTRFGAALKGVERTIRNAVAHIDPQQRILDADHYEDVAACQRVLPILRYIAQEMLANEMTRGRPQGGPGTLQSESLC